MPAIGQEERQPCALEPKCDNDEKKTLLVRHCCTRRAPSDTHLPLLVTSSNNNTSGGKNRGKSIKSRNVPRTSLQMDTWIHIRGHVLPPPEYHVHVCHVQYLMRAIAAGLKQIFSRRQGVQVHCYTRLQDVKDLFLFSVFGLLAINPFQTSPYFST